MADGGKDVEDCVVKLKGEKEFILLGDRYYLSDHMQPPSSVPALYSDLDLLFIPRCHM